MDSRLSFQSNLFIEMLSFQLRTQIRTLNEILDSIERSSQFEEDYIKESLKLVNTQLNRLRKLIET